MFPLVLPPAPQVFVPTKDSSDISSLLRYSWFRTGWLAVQSLLGWPMYLLWNAGGREYSRFASHFDPFSPIFSHRERPGVSASTDRQLCWWCMCRTGVRWGPAAWMCACQQAPLLAQSHSIAPTT